jgi:hypothetical protein
LLFEHHQPVNGPLIHVTKPHPIPDRHTAIANKKRFYFLPGIYETLYPGISLMSDAVPGGTTTTCCSKSQTP